MLTVKSFVCATKKGHVHATARFRSYKSPQMDHLVVGDVAIKEAARATSAAVSSLDPAKIRGLEYLDGGTGANNPSEQAWDEMKSLLVPEHDNIDQRVSCFVSIGCGLRGITGAEDNVYGFLAKTLAKMVSKTESTATRFRRVHSSLFREKKSFRLDVTHGMDTIGLEESGKSDAIGNTVDKELQREDIEDTMRAITDRLIWKKCRGLEDFA